MSKLAAFERVVVISMAKSFDELAQGLKQALRDLGKTCRTDFEFDPEPDELAIVLGAHLVVEPCRSLLSRVIVYNFEQLNVGEESAVVDAAYLDLLKEAEVWDYAQTNVAWLKDTLGAQALYLPVAWAPVFERSSLRARPDPKTQDIDVLFYGGLSDRRRGLLQSLTKAGVKVHVAREFGARLEQLIARSKLVLNLHYYEASRVIETPRLAPLVASGVPLVTELADGAEVPLNLRGHLAGGRYTDLVKIIQARLNDPGACRRDAEAARAHFARWRWADLIARGTGVEAPTVPEAVPLPETTSGQPAVAVPKALNIGSGKDFKPEMLNADIQTTLRTDIQLDLADPALIGKTCVSERFGPVGLREGMFEHVVAQDVLEHIPDLAQAMRNVLDLLADGGRFEIGVPYDLSYGAWQDPTHVRAFNERSWYYYTNWHWYMGWLDWRFDLVSEHFVLSDIGEALKAEGRDLEEIKRTPRAVDAMDVVLVKRAVTPREAAIGRKQRYGADGAHKGHGDMARG